VLTRLGKFEILRLLAQGSMGEVYVGRDPIIGREVAIKVIHAVAGMGAQARERFAMEARAAGVLNHPNIVTIHEFGDEQGVLYLAMELVQGEDLGTLIREGTLAPREILEVLAQVCDGLAAAHRHHILHRDIKPSNIRVAREGRSLHAKVLDFGVAKVVNSNLTDEGKVFGTVNYMAPEYLQGGRPDARADLFAVAVILYEALTGIAPFDAPSPGSVIYRVLHEAPLPLPPGASEGLSRDLQGLLDRGLAKDPLDRFQSAEDLAEVLRAAKDPAWRLGQMRDTVLLPIHRGRPGPGHAAQALPPPSEAAPLPPPPETGSFHRTASALLREAGTRGTSPIARAEVRQDLLETTKHQLLETLKVDPTNVKATAMLLVTHYRLGELEAVMDTLRQARKLGLRAVDLRAVPRCDQVVNEEAQAGRLPLDLHGEFMAYLGF
jgi:serine/threonine-protein kinase